MNSPVAESHKSGIRIRIRYIVQLDVQTHIQWQDGVEAYPPQEDRGLPMLHHDGHVLTFREAEDGDMDSV